MRTTLQILDDKMEREQDTSHRPHLGASAIGGECERKTWYSFRWALEPDFTADVLRKFRDGHESEELIARELEQVVELMGRQARFQDGHFGGSVDGIIEGDLAVLAMGRLGLGDLTATSDLDLVFVWDAPAGASSNGIEDGRRTLAASSYFTRLAQTLANWLGGATGEGKLFTIDLRLRPDGEKSGLAPSLARLTAYYRDEAWLWEKLALGKARLVTPAATCGAAAAVKFCVEPGSPFSNLAPQPQNLRKPFNYFPS